MGFCWLNIFLSKLNGSILLLAFYSEENDKIISLNLLISYVPFRIYKYKMLCRLDSLSETAYNL